jgi:hypothetical protein
LAVALARAPIDTAPPASALPKSDKSDLSRGTASAIGPDAIAFAVEVAGIRVVHPGPRSWLTALKARPRT